MAQSKNLSIGKLTLLTSLGAGFEYYDFVVYAILSPWLTQYFFPATQGMLHTLQILAIFASGYLIRPLGGLYFAYLGDRFGRKKVYCLIVLLMSGSTLAIACLPGYQYLGLWAPLLLLLLRMIQGASLGAELPGAIILLAEHAPNKRRGFVCGIQIACIGLGAAGATFICTLTGRLLTATNMLQWGWRYPFILGSILAIIAMVARRRVTESPLFIEQKKQVPHTRPWQLLWQHRAALRQGIGMLLLPAGLVMFVLSLPVLLHRFGYALNDIYPVMTAGYLWCALCIPIFAAFADRTGRRTWLKVCSLLGLVLLAYLLPQLNHRPHPLPLSFLWILIIGLQTWQATLSAAYFTRLTELFPTAIRYLGYAFCYNITYAVCGMIPMLVAWQSTQVHFSLIIGSCFTLLVLLCYLSVSRGKDLTAKNLTNLEYKHIQQ